MKTNFIPLAVPGETLLEDWMEPLNLTTYQMAKHLGVGAIAVKEILEGKRSISPVMALRLGKVTGASSQYWLNLQTQYDLEKAKREKAVQKKIHDLKPLAVA